MRLENGQPLSKHTESHDREHWDYGRMENTGAIWETWPEVRTPHPIDVPFQVYTTFAFY